jgi:hypothetical protein
LCPNALGGLLVGGVDFFFPLPLGGEGHVAGTGIDTFVGVDFFFPLPLEGMLLSEIIDGRSTCADLEHTNQIKDKISRLANKNKFQNICHNFSSLQLEGVSMPSSSWHALASPS